MTSGEVLFHIADLASLVCLLGGILYHVVKVSNRVMSVLQDFPPHRHENGSIIFPKGFEPTEKQTLFRKESA